MKGFEGNKTLLPLVARESSYRGEEPILTHILKQLPPGPKALVVNFRRNEVVEATRRFAPSYCEQPVLNGTGGALLAARRFVEKIQCRRMIITMGDVPLVRSHTYAALASALDAHHFAVLGFRPTDKKQYGVLDIKQGRVERIVEYSYWHKYPPERQESLDTCNAGIYAARRQDLLHYLSVLAARPHSVPKEVDGRWVNVEEYFLTDLVEYMRDDGLSVGCMIAQDPCEVMGVDDLSALQAAQRIFRERGM